MLWRDEWAHQALFRECENPVARNRRTWLSQHRLRHFFHMPRNTAKNLPGGPTNNVSLLTRVARWHIGLPPRCRPDCPGSGRSPPFQSPLKVSRSRRRRPIRLPRLGPRIALASANVLSERIAHSETAHFGFPAAASDHRLMFRRRIAVRGGAAIKDRK